MDLEQLRLSALLSGAGLGEILTGGASVAPTAIEAGQMWRARWDDVVTTVFVDSLVGGFRNEVRVAPITFGAETADDRAIVLPATSTSLDVELSVWPEFVTNIAEIVLEQWVANIEQFQSLEALERAANVGELQYGLPIRNRSGQRAKDKRLLGLVMEALANAARLVSGSGTLPDLIVAAGLAASVLARSLGTPNSVALGIAQGNVAVDLNQARILAPQLGLSPTEILRANPAVPDQLVQAVTSIRIGTSIRALAGSNGLTADEVVVQVAQGSLALAARAEGAESAWVSRVDYYLSMRIGERA